jgi:uncharacterized protein (TIGR03086 family)
MTAHEPATALVAGVTLLERAIGYALGSLLLATPDDLRRPTPCTDWDLAHLLDHMDDSLLALHEATTGRYVGLAPVRGPREPVSALAVVNRLRDRACRLLGEWSRPCAVDPARPHEAPVEDALVSISGRTLPSSLVAVAGALEIAVHGWDVALACGQPRAIPAPLAGELLELAPLLVRPADRPGRFAAPVEVAASAPAGDRLVAFLGRRPD